MTSIPTFKISEGECSIAECKARGPIFARHNRNCRAHCRHETLCHACTIKKRSFHHKLDVTIQCFVCKTVCKDSVFIGKRHRPKCKKCRHKKHTVEIKLQHDATFRGCFYCKYNLTKTKSNVRSVAYSKGLFLCEEHMKLHPDAIRINESPEISIINKVIKDYRSLCNLRRVRGDSHSLSPSPIMTIIPSPTTAFDLFKK
jgi:hypothetical protein